MSVPRAAMVLAAGLGTRMRPLSEHCPKALLPVAGRALVDHAIDHAAAAGLSPVVVNLHHHAAQMRAHLETRAVLLSDESGALLDTGGGLRQALPLLGPSPFVVLNCDALFGGPAPVPLLLAAWNAAAMDGLLLLVPRDAARAHAGRGDFFLDGGRPLRRGTAAAAPFVYAGAQVLAPRALDATPAGPFSANLVWDRLIAARRLGAVVHPGPWVDVGTPAGLAEAEALLAAADG